MTVQSRAKANLGLAPVFLFGAERSGTTLFSMMMGAHPRLAVPLATTGMWYDLYDQITDHGHVPVPQNLDELIADVARSERILLWRTPLDLQRVKENVVSGDFGSLVSAFHAEYALQQGKPMWANIDIATLDKLHVAYRWFPDARFLHIIRDGRDVALSNQTMPFGMGNIAECAQAWERRVRTNIQMGSIIGQHNYLAFRYEDLISEPESTLTRLCDFLEIEFSMEMLNYGRTVDLRVPRDKQWLWPTLKSPPKTENVARWKTQMSRNKQMVFESYAGELLEELGYPVSKHERMSLSAHILDLIYYLDRGGRHKRLLKKLGYSPLSKLEREAKQGAD